MLNNVIKVEIDETEYEISINIGKMINCEKISGKGFISLLQEAETGSVQALSNMLSQCLTIKGESVGMEFVRSLEFDIFDELVQPLIEVVNNSFPKSDKKKVKIIK